MIIILALLLFITLPDFYLRVSVTCFLLYRFFDKPRLIYKKYVFIFLTAIFFFAYIISPYWAVFQNPSYRILSLALLSVLGLVWSYLCSNNIRLPKLSGKPFWLLGLAVILILINYKPLNADIAWRGDEDFHINLTMDLFSNLTQGSSFSISQVFRYPYFSKWASLFFAAPSLYTDVKLYRAVPFLSVLFLAFFLYQKFEEKLHKPILSLLFSLGVVSIPLVYFYTSLLYLEMPIVLLMTVCIFDLKSILYLEHEKLLNRPSWYCLLLISFLKETAIIFLLLILCLRVIHQIKMNIRSSKLIKILLSEITLYLLVLSPCAVYLFFRQYSPIYRAFGGQFNKLLDISNYWIVLSSLFHQLGSLLISAILGFYLIYKKNEIGKAGALAVLFLGIILFFMTDNFLSIGFSRWNLFVLPIVIYTSYYFLTSITKTFQIISIVLVFIANLLFCPILADGTRLPNWGSPRMDTAEYTYPYEQAVKWLSIDRITNSLLLFGQNYPYYGLRFYLSKYDFHPEILQYEIGYYSKFSKEVELSIFNNFFQDYASGKLNNKLMQADTMLYHSMNNLNLNPDGIYGGKFKILKRISNSLHSLYIFRRI